MACQCGCKNPVDVIIDKWNADPDYVIEMFQDIQDACRCIPQDALNRVADRTGRARGTLFHIATFYKAFSLEQKGELEIQICTGTACHVKGAGNVLEAFERELGVMSGGTTEDKKFTLSEVRCVGACGLAPVVVVGEDVIGAVTPSMVPGIIKKYRGEG